MMKIQLKRSLTVMLLSALVTFNASAKESAPEVLSLPNQECVFSGSFTQSKDILGLDEPLESQGSFFYHCKLGVIWKTQIPVAQTMIFQRSGKAFNLQEGSVEAMKSSQGKVLGKLLNSLIGGDTQQVLKQFTVLSSPETTPTEQRYDLTPKRRSLKRGLKLLTLSFPIDQQEGDEPHVNISIWDRNEQWTHITSKKTSPTEEGAPLALCSSFSPLTSQECSLLKGS